ncbi:MAG: NAD-dependent epimerase/dehydratase family protein [Candidatus Aureabacteria bacterium]|nr:NAD-dependent epimerase/dehydratase family protein [Candidatus Auribacterota bacterium]
MKNIKILITGAGGFLGSHISQYLTDRSYKVAINGRFSPKYFKTIHDHNWWKSYGMTLPDKRFIHMIKEIQPHFLVHCAGSASVQHSMKEPYRDFLANVKMCAFILENLRIYAPECHFIFLSSAAVYGNPLSLPVNENTLCKPVSPYGYHKMLCENLIEEYSSIYGLRTTILRIFSAYGERLKKQVIYDLFKKISDPATFRIEVLGTGNETRDFIHALDIAKAIEIIILNQSCGIFNLGSGQEIEIHALVEKIKNILQSSLPVHYSNVVRQGDPLNWRADMNKIMSIGFTPSIPFDEGLKKYCTWLNTSC